MCLGRCPVSDWAQVAPRTSRCTPGWHSHRSNDYAVIQFAYSRALGHHLPLPARPVQCSCGPPQHAVRRPTAVMTAARTQAFEIASSNGPPFCFSQLYTIMMSVPKEKCRTPRSK